MSDLVALRLYWKRDGEDVEIGTGACPGLPPVGSLLSLVTDYGVIWRVTQLYFHLVSPNSPTWRDWRERRPHGPEFVEVFVEPAEGPFES